MSTQSEREARQRVRGFYDANAGQYDEWLGHYDRWLGLAELRRELIARARGSVLELGMGTGRNLALYSADVVLTGVDASPAMLALARERARRLGIAADLRVGDAYALDLQSDHFDGAVATLVLSAISDSRRAAAELHRVLKPGGALLLLDHVRSPWLPVRLVQRAIDPFVRRHWHFSFLSDPIDYLEVLGFRIERCKRTRLGVVESLVARKL